MMTFSSGPLVDQRGKRILRFSTIAASFTYIVYLSIIEKFWVLGFAAAAHTVRFSDFYKLYTYEMELCSNSKYSHNHGLISFIGYSKSKQKLDRVGALYHYTSVSARSPDQNKISPNARSKSKQNQF